ncbi:MAG: DUF6221 family protein [Gemmatimonadaceae bacterium]
MTDDLISRLRAAIEHRKALAEASANKPRRIPRMVTDETATWGTRWEYDEVQDGGHWRYDEVQEGYYRGQARIVSTAHEGLGVVAGSCNCCGVTAEGRKEDLLHIVENDPGTVLARCKADLALLDEHAIVQTRAVGEDLRAVWIDVCQCCGNRHGVPCRTVRLLAEGYGITEEET